MPEVAIIDYGMGNLRSVAKGFERVGAEAVVTARREDILAATHLVLPGVGAFRACMEGVERLGLTDVIREFIATGRPFLGICLGHQVIALALGAKTYKLKFGHRGVNQPVKDLDTGRIYITSHNHGYAVDEKTIEGTGLRVRQVNLNDGTVEGMVHEELPIITTQYHPEGHLGPRDNEGIFDEFLRLVSQY